MKRYLSLLSVCALLTPVMASAASVTDLMASMQFVPSSSVSVQASTHLDGTYVSVWADGTVGMSSPVMDLTGTVDVARNNRTVRMKGALRIVPEGTFLRVDSVHGSLRTEDRGILDSFPTFETWLQIMPATIAEESISDSTWFSVITGDSTSPEFVYNMKEQSAGSSTKYTVTLKPDAAAKLAESLLDILGGDRPITRDFFPWRSYAESLDYTSTVMMDANGQPDSRTSSVKVKGSRSYMNLTVHEDFLSEVAMFDVPADSVPYNNSLNILTGGTSPSTITTDFSDVNPSIIDANFNTVDVGGGITCSTATPLRLIGLQRSGDCPAEFTSRRNLIRPNLQSR